MSWKPLSWTWRVRRRRCARALVPHCCNRQARVRRPTSRRCRFSRLTDCSTKSLYGDPLVHPQPEEYWGNVDPIGPRSCYDEGKRFGEALVTAARREIGVRVVIARPFNTYGPDMRRDDGRVIPEMISAAIEGRPVSVHGNGTQTRSFCYVSDLVYGRRPERDEELAAVGVGSGIGHRQDAGAIVP